MGPQGPQGLKGDPGDASVELGDYYNKTEVDNRLLLKQNLLESGNYITISDGKIAEYRDNL